MTPQTVTPDTNDGLFQCDRCLVFKITEEFHWIKRTGRYCNICKACNRERCRKYYLNNRGEIETMIDAKSILRGALVLAKVTELEAMILIQEIFEEEKEKP